MSYLTKTPADAASSYSIDRRCLNCRAFAYMMLDRGIHVDDGWLCEFCVKRDSSATTATHWPERYAIISDDKYQQIHMPKAYEVCRELNERMRQQYKEHWGFRC